MVRVEEESLVEPLLRGLLAVFEPGHAIEIASSRHGGSDGGSLWPDPPAPDPVAAARWQTWTAQVPERAGEPVAQSQTTRPDDSAAWSAPGATGPSSAGSGTPPVSLAADPGETVAALTAALDAVAAQDPVSLPGPQALARSRALLQAGERLMALGLEALSDVETRTLHALDDAPTLAAWVNGLRLPGVDSRAVALARRWRRVPQIAQQVRAGRMSSRTAATLTTAVAKARPFLDRPDGLVDGLDGERVLEGVLVRGVSSLVAEQVGGAADAEARLAALRDELQALNDPTATQLARWEAALVVFARECDPALLSSGTALLVDALLPNEHEKRARQAEEEAGVDLTRRTLGSGWDIRGRLDDETGEMVAVMLEATSATDPAGADDTRQHAEGKQAVGDDTLPPHEWPVDLPAPRSKRRQRHDALKRGIKALLDSGVLGVRGKAVPHIAVTVPLDYLEGVPGSLPARTDHGLRLSREHVRPLLCRSAFTRLLLDARHRVVEASHTQRTSTAFERLLLKTQGGAVCWGRGCARGPATGHRLIPHHGSLFSKTGTTELADTALLCEPDHDHDLHAQGRRLTLKDGRVLGPDGWVRP